MSDWDFLGVSRGATAEELRAAFRKKALELHPDRVPGPEAAARFKEISAAYDRIVAGNGRGGDALGDIKDLKAKNGTVGGETFADMAEAFVRGSGGETFRTFVTGFDFGFGPDSQVTIRYDPKTRTWERKA